MLYTLRVEMGNPGLRAKKLLPILLALVILASLVGCAKEGKTTTEQLTEGVTAAATDIQTYRFDISTKTGMSIETDTETREIKTSGEGSAVVDNTNKKMQRKMSMEVETPEGTQSTETEEYLIGDMMYTKTVMPGMPEQWMTQAMTAGLWEAQNQVEQQMRLLKVSEIEILGSEQVNGVECWVVKLLPSLEKFWEVVGEGTEEVPPEEFFESLSVKQWFAKDTYYLMKAEMEWTAHIIIAEYKQPMVNRMEIECSHYNELVSIELPPGAEEAAEGPPGREKMHVQLAVSALMTENGISVIPNPVSSATAVNDMSAFPDSTSDNTATGGTVGGKVKDRDGNVYNFAGTPSDKAGYVLYGHDIKGSGAGNDDGARVNFVAQQYTKYYYTVDANGLVHQFRDAAKTGGEL